MGSEDRPENKQRKPTKANSINHVAQAHGCALVVHTLRNGPEESAHLLSPSPSCPFLRAEQPDHSFLGGFNAVRSLPRQVMSKFLGHLSSPQSTSQRGSCSQQRATKWSLKPAPFWSPQKESRYSWGSQMNFKCSEVGCR